tara:strand:+ start:122 stop:364 length:243 start_codon:yes stop_codon:yes gene_type:complete
MAFSCRLDPVADHQLAMLAAFRGLRKIDLVRDAVAYFLERPENTRDIAHVVPLSNDTALVVEIDGEDPSDLDLSQLIIAP